MNDFKCTRADHCHLQIQGSCENVNCLQQYRRVCLKCIPLHRINDKEFIESDIKTSDDITNIFNLFGNKTREMLNDIFLQCKIQNVILITEIIEFINNWSLRQQRLMKIQDELQQFEQQQWSKLNIEKYIYDENSNQGIYKYLQNIEDQFIKIQNMMDDYIKQKVSTNQQNDPQKENLIQNLFQNTLQLLRDYQTNTFQRLLGNKSFKEKGRNENPYVSIFEILMKQGQNLSSNVPINQFNQVRNSFLTKIKDFENYYLQGISSDKFKACSIVYSIDSQKHLDESYDLITKSIQLNNKYAKAQYLKGIIQFDKKQFEEAIKSFNQCIKLDSEYQDAYNALGREYMQKKEILIKIKKDTQKPKSVMIKHYTLILNPLNQLLEKVNNIQQLADVLNAQGVYKEAIELYDQAIKLDSKNPQSYYAKGIALHNMQQYQQAIEAYNMALNVIQGTDFKQSILGSNSQGQNDQVIKQQKMTHVFYNKGRALESLNKYAEAIDMFNLEIQINPNDIAAYKKKGLLLLIFIKENLSSSNRNFKRPQLFITRFQRQLQIIQMDILPKVTTQTQFVGDLLLLLQKPQEAKKIFQQCIQINPNNVIAQKKLKLI